MANFSISVSIKQSNGVTSSYNTEVELPNHLDSKIGNSSYKDEIIGALESALPQRLGGADWRKNGGEVVGFNNVRKL